MEPRRGWRLERRRRNCWWVRLVLSLQLHGHAFSTSRDSGLTRFVDQNKPGEIWAIALSSDGQYLASSSINGKINVWSLNKAEGMPRIREYETKGSFGLCVDLVCLTVTLTVSH